MGPTSKGRGRDEREREGKGREGRGGKGKGGGEEGVRVGPKLKLGPQNYFPGAGAGKK